MSPQELQKRQNRAENETLIISRSEDGYKVHSPTSPGKPYVVQLSDDEAPTCTCPDFSSHQQNPEWRCKHILAVMARMVPRSSASTGTAQTERVEQAAVSQEEKPTVRRRRIQSNGNGAGRMLLKRSVSPDGRIDSLSVEVETLASDTDEETRASAVRVMRLQDRIVEDFLDGRGTEDNSPQQSASPTAVQPTDGAIAAKLLDIGGMTGKWGRRLFINVQASGSAANGQTLKVFGNRKQLGDHLVAIGQPRLAERIEEGMRIDVACRVITEPSADGRFTNIVNVLPAGNGPQGRSRS